MKKSYSPGWRLLSLVLLLMLLAACDINLPDVTENQRIIVLWHTFSGEEADAFQTLVDGYNAAHQPEVVLIAEYQEDILNKLHNAPEGSRPDIVTLLPKDLPVFQALDLISLYPTESEAILRSQQDLLPMGTALYSVNNQPVGVTLGLATYLLYYNAEWTNDLGYATDSATHEDLRRTACAATDPLTGQIGLGIPAKSSMMLAFLAAGGSQIVGDDGQYQFSDTAGLTYGQTLHDILWGGCGEVYSDWDVGLDRLSKSAMAMAVDSSKMLLEIEANVAAGRNFQLQISPIPGISEPGITLWYGPGMVVVSDDPAQAAQSLEVLDYFTSAESQTQWAAQTDYLPVRRSLLEASLETDTEFATLEQTLAKITLDAAAQGTWTVWSPYNDHMACRQPLLRALQKLSEENAVPEQYIGTAVTGCNTAMRAPLLPEPTATPSEASQP